MKLLLDTHIYLWVRADDAHLPPHFRHAIADPANTKYVSSISAAEIAVKSTIGKVSIDGDVLGDIAGIGLDTLPFTHEHARVLAALPLNHRDPFDRMLIAQAIADDLVFLTINTACTAYDVALLSNPDQA